MSEQDVIAVLAVLSDAYGREPDSVTPYVWTLEDFESADLMAAAREAVKVHTWMPKAAELLPLAKKAKAGRERLEEPRRVYWRALQVWGAWAAGKISDADFESDRAIAYMRREYGDRSWWASEEGYNAEQPYRDEIDRRVEAAQAAGA